MYSIKFTNISSLLFINLFIKFKCQFINQLTTASKENVTAVLLKIKITKRHYYLKRCSLLIHGIEK